MLCFVCEWLCERCLGLLLLCTQFVREKDEKPVPTQISEFPLVILASPLCERQRLSGFHRFVSIDLWFGSTMEHRIMLHPS